MFFPTLRRLKQWHGGPIQEEPMFLLWLAIGFFLGVVATVAVIEYSSQW